MSWLLPDWLTGHDPDNYQAGLDAAKKNAELNKKLHDDGKLSDADYALTQRRYLEDASYDPDEEIENAFMEGLDEGAANIRNGVGSTINTVVGTPLKLIPWQVWLAAALWLAWKMGAFNGLLKGAFKKAARRG